MNKKNSFIIRSSKQLIHIIGFITGHGLISERLGDTAIAIAYNWNKEQDIYPNKETIAQRIDVKNVRTVYTYISDLKKLGLIDYHQPKSQDNKHRSNNYTFNYDVLASLYTKAKKLAAKLKREAQQQDCQHDDPTPLDPPITSSFQSEEHRDLYITETQEPVSISFINFLKLDAFGNEHNHIGKLKQNSVLKRIKGEKTKRQRFLESLFAEQDRNRRESAEQLQRMVNERNEKAEQANNERNTLIGALWKWHSSGTGFTQTMYQRLIELNRGALTGMEALIAKRFLAE
ncbi:hypothetical protein NTE19_003385 [Vibrio fluvialis]|nr:hypothetical protein [Vibrio fluvialis]